MSGCVIMGLRHNGAFWEIVRIDRSYFARCRGSDTGPYSTAEQAIDFIKAVKP